MFKTIKQKNIRTKKITGSVAKFTWIYARAKNLFVGVGRIGISGNLERRGSLLPRECKVKNSGGDDHGCGEHETLGDRRSHVVGTEKWKKGYNVVFWEERGAENLCWP